MKNFLIAILFCLSTNAFAQSMGERYLITVGAAQTAFYGNDGDDKVLAMTYIAGIVTALRYSPGICSSSVSHAAFVEQGVTMTYSELVMNTKSAGSKTLLVDAIYSGLRAAYPCRRK